MKIKTGEIVDKNKDKNVVSSVKLSKGTRVGTLKLTVNGEEQDSVPIRGLGGGSSTVIGGSVDTQALWDAINKKVDIDFFKNLFTVYDSSDIEIATNTYTRKPDNLKISVGTWTEEYLSALGKNSEGGGGGGVGTVIGIALGTGTTPIYPDDDTGIVTLPAYPTKVSQLANDSGFVTSSTLNNYVTSSYLANNFYTKAQADSKYMTIAAFESLFNALDSNGDKINHPYSSGVDSIKALVGLWTEEYLSALGQNSEGGSSGGGSVNAIKVGTNPDTYLDPVDGIIDMSNYVTTAAQRTLWTNSAHTHSNKAVLDNITAGQVAAWNNMAAIMEEDQDNIINKWNEVVDFLSTYTEADTLANLLSNKLDVEFFRRIFTVYDEDGNTIVPNTYTQVADNLKILVGAWTEEYLSALGKNSEGGGGGTGTVTSVKIASNPDVFIDPVDGIIDMSSYVTTWNNKQDAISDLATIRSNASNGNTAYSWGNHANAGYAQASNTVSNVAYNTTGKKLTKTINGNTTDIVSASTIVTDGGGAKASTTITAGNGLTGGGDLSSNRTINVVSANVAITVNADNIKLNVINDYTTTTNNTIIPLAAARGKDLNDRLAVLESWFEVDSDGNVKTKDMPNGTHRGFYTESFVSALGSNSEGGGSGADLEDVWDSLTNQQGTVITDNTKIAIAHIPDTSSTYGYLKSSALNGYATQSWVNQQGFLTTHQTLYTLSIYGGTTKVLDFKPNANASIYIKAGGDISLTNDTTNKYITLSYTHPTNGANTTISAASGKVLSAITVNSLGHVTSVSSKTLASADIPDISATYATASRATTLEGYFTNGVANSAAKLNTGTTTYSAWGQTYWSSGVPQSISGNMTSVGSITPSANGNALGTTSARFNIYGTSGNFSGNVSISGTLGVTGATTLSSTLSVAGGITLTTTKKIYFGDTSHYIELDSTGFHFSHGVYSDSFVSALGANSSGGGGGGADLSEVWDSLTNQTGTTPTSTTKIAVAHIPDISSTYGYAKTSQLGNYLPLSGGTMTGTVWRKMTVDSSNYEVSVGWVNTSGSAIAEIGYLNTSQKIVINPTKATSPWTDAVGKYVLNVGNNLLTYNTYNILHANNYSDYALPLTGGTLYKSTTDAPLYVKTFNASGAYIGFQKNDGTTIGFIGVHPTYGAVYVSSGTTYPILRSDNYSSYALPLSGGTMTGSITFNAVNKGIYLKDSDDNTFAGIIQNSDNFWIGAQQTTATHHSGSTFISAGSGQAYISRLVNSTRTNYKILDTGNTYVTSGKGYIDGTEITTISGNAATATGLRLVSTNANPSDANDSTLVAGGIMYNYASTAYWRNTPSGMDYGSIICFSSGIGSLGAQFAWDVEHNSTTSTKKLWFRAQNNLGYQNDWKEIITSSGGTITGSLTVHNNSVTAYSYNAKFDVDTSREMGYNWLNTSDTKVASVTYHNTSQNIIINPIGSSNTWSDAVGKYSLIVGNNKLTYNTYTILHSNNYSSYALPLSGGTMTGTLKWANGTALPNATTADYLLTIDAFASGGTTKWIGAANVTVGRATNADNADKLDGIDSRSIDSIYTGGWCAGTGTYYGKIAEYTSATSGTVDCTATFLLTDYQTTGASSGNILVVRFRSSSPTSTPIINASWAVKNSDMDIYVRYQISNSRTYVRIYSLSAGWGRAINIKLLRAHSWSGSNITSWVLYSATNTTSGDVAAYSSLPTAETAVTVTNNNIIAGEVTATSDERLKTIVGDGNLDLRYIANAPNILFKWNNGQDDKVHGGSLAQYFLTGAKHFVLGSDKDFYSLNYGALATSMAISIAKEVVKHEDRITLLEKENAKLKARVAELEERRVA